MWLLPFIEIGSEEAVFWAIQGLKMKITFSKTGIKRSALLNILIGVNMVLIQTTSYLHTSQAISANYKIQVLFRRILKK